MSRELNLDGGEISVLKALGFGGSGLVGEDLLGRVSDLDSAELIDTLQGLMMMGYVVADKQSFHSLEDMRKIHFHVNSGYSKDIKEALDPSTRDKPKKSRRVRRE